MHPFHVCLIVFSIVLVVCAICLAILHNTRSREQIQTIMPSLQEVYNASQIEDNIHLSTISKPFAIMSFLKTSQPVQALNFDNATMGALQLSTPALVGFCFSVTNYMNITAFQFVAQYGLSSSTHPCAIYDYESKVALASSTMLRNTDPINANGFATHVLNVPMPLEPFRDYVFVMQVNANDFVGTNTNMMQTINAVKLKIPYFNSNATAITFPTFEVSNITYRHFGSFQLQMQTSDSLRPVFDVSMATGGYARFPPGYIRGCTFVVEDADHHIDIEPGFASSQFGDANIVLPLAVRLVPSVTGMNGLDVGTLMPATWYSLYLVGSSILGLPTCCMLSLGFKEPALMPQGYDVFRRIGSLLTNDTASPNTKLRFVSQEGDGATRTTYFTDDPFTRRVFEDYDSKDLSVYQPFSLPFVPATATRCILTILGDISTATPTNMKIHFRRRHQTTEGVWVLSISETPSFSAQIEITLGSFPLTHELEMRVSNMPPRYRWTLTPQAYYEIL